MRTVSGLIGKYMAIIVLAVSVLALFLPDLSSTISFIENMNVGNSTLVTCKRYIHFLRTILYY